MHIFEDDWGNVETSVDSSKVDNDRVRNYCQVAVNMVKEGMRLYGQGNWSSGWTLAQDDVKDGIRAYNIKTENMGRVIGAETTVNVDLKTANHEAWYNIEKVTEYIPTVRNYKILTEYTNHTRLVHTGSHEIFGGLVSSRDFVDVNTYRKIGDVYYYGGCSVQQKEFPPQKNRIRGDNLLGWMRLEESPTEKGQTKLCMLASTDLKGMLPKGITDRAMTHYLVDYVRHFKKHLESLKTI